MADAASPDKQHSICGSILGGLPVRCRYTSARWTLLGRLLMPGDAIRAS